MFRPRAAVTARLIAVSSLMLAHGLLAMAALSSESPRESAASGRPAAAQKITEAQVPPQDLPTLEPGKPIERPLAGGETHRYLVSLSAGEYLQVLVDQRGVDVAVTLIAPDGQKLAEMDSPNSTQGPELVSVLAEQSGAYRVEIISSRKNVPAGRYELRIVAIRDANELDKKRVEAQKAYLEAGQLRGDDTVESRRNAIKKYEEALQNWRTTGETLMEVHTLSSYALAHRQLGQLQTALELYNKALQVVQSVKERREEAALLGGIAVLYGEMGNPQKAGEYYERVLRTWQEIGDVFLLAKTHNNLGLAYALLGEPRNALEHYNAALSVWQEMGNREQEAFTVHNIGGVYEVLGDTEKSLEYYNRSLVLFRSLGNHGGEAEDLNSIGGAYRFNGDFQRALEYFNQALVLWRTGGNRPREALALKNIGEGYAALGDQQKALEHYNQALKLFRDVGDRRFEALTLERIGTQYASSSEYQKALEYYGQALELRRAAADRWGEASVLTSTGFAYVSSGAPQKALDYFAPSLKLFVDVGDRRGEAKTRFGIARAERDRGNLAEARKQIETALSLTEAVRADVNSPQLRATYLATVEDYFHFYIDLLMRLDKTRPNEGFAALALQTSERARARSLLDLLSESHVEIRKGADPLLLEKEHALAQQLNAKAQRRVQLFGQKAREEQLASLNKEISDLEIENEQLQAAIRKASPAYAALTQPRPLGLKEIQQQLDSNTLLLQYSLGEERSYLWVVAQNSLQTYEMPKREQIEKSSRKVYGLLTERSLFKRGETAPQRQERVASADLKLLEAVGELSRMVIAPAASELGNRRLVVVADGALQYIPFAALSDLSVSDRQLSAARNDNQPRTTGNVPLTSDTYRPLILQHEIVSLPSASSLAVQRKGLAGRKPAPKGIAVIADPVFSTSDERFKTNAATANARRDYSNVNIGTRIIEHIADDPGAGNLVIRRLRFTRQEADQILAEAPGRANLKAIDFKANRATVMSGELSKYRYVHFATHGYLDSERPELSAVVLSLVDEQGNPEDGFLRAHEIYNLNLPAELVVLSACQTGLGEEIKGEGLIGLTRGFMYAGARRVVVSLWNVNDKATAELMQRFYRGILKGHETPAAALRAAQVEMWQQKQWRSPYFWAAFVQQGEWK